MNRAVWGTTLAAAVWPLLAMAMTVVPEGKPEVGADGVRLSVRIVSTNDVFMPEVSWRFEGESSFRSEPLRRKQPGLYSGVIPARPLEKAIEYRLVAFDSKTLDEGDWPARDKVETLARQAAPQASAGETPPGDGLRLELTVVARRPGEAEPSVLAGGETLAQGAKVAFGIKTTQKAYVYLAQRHHSGAFDVIFPNEGAINTRNPVAANEYVRIPAQTWFEVDNKDLGRETVMVLASTKPISDLEKAFKKASKGKSGKAAHGEFLAIASEEPRCRPGGLGRGLKLQGTDDCRPLTKGLILPTADAGDGVRKTSFRVQARPKDTLVYVPFEFEHIPRKSEE